MALPVSGVLKLTDIIAEVGEGSSLATAIAASGESFDRQSDFYGYSSVPDFVIDNAVVSAIGFLYYTVDSILSLPTPTSFSKDTFADAQRLIYGQDTATRDKFKMIWAGEYIAPAPGYTAHYAMGAISPLNENNQRGFIYLASNAAHRVDNNNLSGPTGWQGNITRFRMGDVNLTGIKYWPPEVCLPAGPGYPSGYYLDTEADLSVLEGGNWYGMISAGAGMGDSLGIIGLDRTQVPQDRQELVLGGANGTPLPIDFDGEFKWTGVSPGVQDTDTADDLYQYYKPWIELREAIQTKL